MPTEVLYRAPVYNPTGYGTEARHFVRGLHGAGLPVRLVPRPENRDTFRILEPAEANLFQALTRRRPQGGPGVEVQHLPPPLWKDEPGQHPRVARTMAETVGLPQNWRHLLNRMQRVLVPSSFCQEQFANAGVHPDRLRIVPGGVDTDQFRPGLPPLEIPGRRGFVFLALFDWNRRKGWDVLLRAYLSAFHPNDDVTLLMKVFSYNGRHGNAQAEVSHYVQTELGIPSGDHAHVILTDNALPVQDIPHLFAAANAFVLPSRGEAWGLPYCEAMACGLPVIAARWGGHLDYTHDQNAYLVDIEGLRPVRGMNPKYYAANQLWCEPSVEHLRTLLQQVVLQPEEARTRGARARADMENRWQWRHAVAKMKQQLLELTGG